MARPLLLLLLPVLLQGQGARPGLLQGQGARPGYRTLAAFAPALARRARHVSPLHGPHPAAPSGPGARFPSREPPSLGPGGRGAIQPLFTDNIIREEGEAGWVVPPSLMAVAAVPGAPVVAGRAAVQRVPRDRKGMDPYLQFMPVPAVPGLGDSQESRRPKDSLNSLDLNLNLPNTVEEARPHAVTSHRSSRRPATRRPATRRPATRRPATRRPATRRPATRAPATGAPATRAPATRAPVTRPPVTRAPARFVPGAADKKAIRKKFKRCHGRCVQKQCLPVGLLGVYDKCVEKCRGLCT